MYLGQIGWTSFADMILRYYNPGGRVALTSHLSTMDLPTTRQQDLYYGNGITYRYFKCKVVYFHLILD